MRMPVLVVDKVDVAVADSAVHTSKFVYSD